MIDADHLGDLGRLPERVIVANTATLRGTPIRRLPDRQDDRGTIAAYLVETDAIARQLFRSLDAVGRTIYVDVERKQAIDLMSIACTEIRHATVQPHKPNDVTVRSFDVLVTEICGPQVSGLAAGVFGTGNLAFKAALLLAERGAAVSLQGRSPDAVARVIAAINAILPQFSAEPVRGWGQESVQLMVTAVSASGVVGPSWLSRLGPQATVIDVGIGNLSAEFISGAIAGGHQVLRLDTRASGGQVAQAAPDFFARRFGRAVIAGVPVVSGGIVGPRGTVVLDSHVGPTTIIGVADGVGGLLPPAQLNTNEAEGVARVEAFLRGHQTVR